MDSNELNTILENHKHWINQDCEGWENMRADLQNADLQGDDLHGVDLRGANMESANLCNANLQHAKLQNADMQNVNMQNAYLRQANMQNADMQFADLQDAHLRYTNLRHVNLDHVNLQRADLYKADLKGANIDYSCLPLWCGSLNANFDSKQLKQIAYHLIKAGLQSTNATKKDKQELSKLIDYANSFHRAKECGFIAKEMEK